MKTIFRSAAVHPYNCVRILVGVLIALAWLALSAAPARATITVVSYWRMGENDPGATAGATATATTDSVGSHKLTCSGQALYSTDVSPAALVHTDSMLSVNFTNSAYASNSAVVSTAQDNFGIEAWVEPTALPTRQVIAFNGSIDTNGWGIVVEGSSYKGLIGDLLVGPSTATAASNVWTHVALVRNNGVATLYTNGVAAGNTSTAAPGLPTGSFALGSDLPSPLFVSFSGLMDEVRV